LFFFVSFFIFIYQNIIYETSKPFIIPEFVVEEADASVLILLGGG